MSKKVTIKFSFIIPSSEIMDVDMPALKDFIKEQLGVDENADSTKGQFRHYDLSDFSPKIIEQKIENI